ncbi:MAG TPA: isoaspartyl peptidase/L-asparaginase [Ktedonobacteraceae bacterium]|nr:isoaspartyl peptidase/L-asparaginase [Ktedonobacteraceae bacterium]
MTISIIVHGGAGDIAAERHASAQQGCQEAALVGWQVLQAGGSALDAVEAAVRVLEDNPAYNAGTGACLSAEGHIELDAGIMDGRTLNLGAVAGIELIKNPISLARKVMDSPHVMLAGRGAEQFAEENGIARCRFEDLLTERQYARWQEYLTSHGISPTDEPGIIRREVSALAARPEKKHGTVGAVAVDNTGAVAAATSTGGIHNKYPGRVGDSPLVGCGFYADEVAAVSCTGHGEDFVRLMIARRAAEFVAQGYTAEAAAQAAIAFLSARATGTGGLILVDATGGIGFAWNSQSMARAYMTEGLETPVVGI